MKSQSAKFLPITGHPGVVAVMAVLLHAAVFITTPANAKPDLAQARTVVATLTDKAVGVLNRSGSSRNERAAEFRVLLREYFAFDEISQAVAGKYWRRMSDSQRTDYKRLFADWTAKTYAIRLGNYQGETVKIDKALPLNGDTIVVRTNVAGAERKFNVEWRLREVAGEPKIIDVIVDGLSMVATRRSEIASIIERKSIDGLIDTLRMNIDATETGTPG